MEALNPENLEAFAKLAMGAVQSGNWGLVVALALILIVFLVRKFLGDKVPFLKSQAGGALLNLVLAFGGSLGTALIAGAQMDLALALTAFKVAFTAAGGWTIVKHLLTLIKGKDPEQIKAEAEAEGAKAGEQAQAEGKILSIADVVNKPEDKP